MRTLKTRRTWKKTFIEVNKEKLKKKLKQVKFSLFLIQFHSLFHCFLLIVNSRKFCFYCFLSSGIGKELPSGLRKALAICKQWCVLRWAQRVGRWHCPWPMSWLLSLATSRSSTRWWAMWRITLSHLPPVSWESGHTMPGTESLDKYLPDGFSPHRWALVCKCLAGEWWWECVLVTHR